jgi:hypothetical protein
MYRVSNLILILSATRDEDNLYYLDINTEGPTYEDLSQELI